jgi:hypothetical protein
MIWRAQANKKVQMGSLDRKGRSWGDRNSLTGVLAEPLKHTAAVDWERQYQGDSIRDPVTMVHDESMENGAAQRADGRLSTISIWPCWQRGQRVNDRPVSS